MAKCHVVPRGSGGSSDEENLVPACYRCNQLRCFLHSIVTGAIPAVSRVASARQWYKDYGSKDPWLEEYRTQFDAWFEQFDRWIVEATATFPLREWIDKKLR